MLKRWAKHLGAGAKIHGKDNWTLANSHEELEDYKESALRHCIQWVNGETDEDHAAAIYFNINAAESVKEKLTNDGK
jgi:hypothetical protein